MYHTNCDDAQTDQGLVWSYFPQINISGKQNQSQKRCEARGVSSAQADLSLRHARAISVISLVHVQPNSIRTIRSV